MRTRSKNGTYGYAQLILSGDCVVLYKIKLPIRSLSLIDLFLRYSNILLICKNDKLISYISQAAQYEDEKEHMKLSA